MEHLSEQIDNIEEQYAQRITDAEAGKSEKLKTTLMEERDAKIDDIRKNFESDAYVEAKIRVSKEQQLERMDNNGFKMLRRIFTFRLL